DGSGAKRLTDFFADDTWPSWSPDERKIAFYGPRNSVNSDIYLLDIRNNTVGRLTSNTSEEQTPMWAPDASRIAFATNRDGNFEIYSMNPDGKDQKNLTNDPGGDARPWWSARGREICFTSTRQSGNNEIWIMNFDGSNPKRLTNSPATDDFCSLK
ncbi:MAG: DPP IV N-terminal domain-containing protein, partial [Gemmatimonadaceae bacterium]